MRSDDSGIFPSEADAPDQLAAYSLSGCGPVVAWQVLRYYDRDVAPNEILRACRFDSDVGTYAIGLAVGLAELGLCVEFSTDVDPDPMPVERELYAKAAALGITILPGASLMELGTRLGRSTLGIILYQVDERAVHGHFSPLVAIRDGVPQLPNEFLAFSLSDLEHRRASAGLFRQCILASASREA